MNKTLATLAGAAALISAPLAIPSAALAQNHGGGHAGGGFHAGGGYHGASFGGGFRGGYRGGGYDRGGHWYGGGYGPALGIGLGLGLGLAPYYDDYGYYPDAYPAYAAPAYGYAPPCGQWVWSPATGRYEWAAGAC